MVRGVGCAVFVNLKIRLPASKELANHRMHLRGHGMQQNNPRTLAKIGAAIALLFATPGAAAAPGRIGVMKVMLWYEETGRLSENIAPPRTVNLWNTCIGEGDAQENANDVLFTVEVRTSGQQNVSQQLTLTATGPKGVVLSRRVFTSILTGDNGSASLPLWVKNVGCGAGPVTFSARLGSQSRSFTLQFEGGE